MLLTTGCVERTWTIKSEPSGALVYVSGVEKGRTPVTLNFTYYGTYEVILRKEGYQTLKEDIEINAPWYQAPVIDFFTEISPKKYEDKRMTMHILRKKRPPTPEEIQALKDRADRIRQEAITGEKTQPTSRKNDDNNIAPEDRFKTDESRRRIVMPNRER